MSIVVAQLGARMHYAVPRMLHHASLLERLYTDICARKEWMEGLNLLPASLRPARIQRFFNRVPEEIPPHLITAFNLFGLEYARRLAMAKNTDQRIEAFLWSGKAFCRHIISKGFGQAKAVYVYNSAGLEVLQEARRRGLKGIMEQTIAPKFVERKVMSDESARFPDWESTAKEASMIDDYCAREAAEWAEADLILCGSEYVREGILRYGGDKERCVVVPYGINRNVAPAAKENREAGPLRVLTVGAIGLRKGSPDVLAAAKRLAGRAHFRMVGDIQILPQAEKSLRQHVELTGIIPRSQMASQYAWADVFLLPSLCEGSATSTYEAMFQGLPIICTPQTGSTVRDGVDGFIVPAQNTDAIAEKLEILAANPDRLASMSENALKNSQAYTLSKYGERLLQCFRERL